MNKLVYAVFEASEADKRALIILLVLLAIALLLIGLIGVAIRFAMRFQARRADTMMHDVAKSRVIDNPRDFIRFGWKKNCRVLYRDSLLPFLVALVGIIIWVIFNLATGRWQDNIFEHFGELFFRIKTDNSQYPPDDPLFVKVFGVTLFARWPELEPGFPTFNVEHLCSYISVALFIVSWVWYAVLCQAFISRQWMIYRRSRTVYEKSLEGFNANSDINVKQDKPLPPSE